MNFRKDFVSLPFAALIPDKRAADQRSLRYLRSTVQSGYIIRCFAKGGFFAKYFLMPFSIASAIWSWY
jgi:hypothetical protein